MNLRYIFKAKLTELEGQLVVEDNNTLMLLICLLKIPTLAQSISNSV